MTELPAEKNVLRRQDIIEHEARIATAIKTFLSFSSHSLVFPADAHHAAPSAAHPYGLAVQEEDRLMLPLAHGGKLLAIFSAGGTNPEETQPALPYLPIMAHLCLELILLRKKAETDPLTGLLNKACLHQALVQEISGIPSSIMPGPDTVTDDSLHMHSACLGLLVVDLDRFRHINEQYGHLFGDDLLMRTAEHLRRICPSRSTVYRLDGDAFGVLWPQASRVRTGELAHAISEELQRITARFEPLREEVQLSACVGFTNYPQDFQGAQFRRAAEEQARMVLEKAEKALHAAQAAGRAQICSFRQILAQGGVVLEVMPMNRLVVSLGRSVDACEGQRFLIRSDRQDAFTDRYPSAYKAEVSLMDVQDDFAMAEILVQTDPAWAVKKGDKLILLEEHAGLTEQFPPDSKNEPLRKDPLTGLYPYRGFLRAWRKARSRAKIFCLVLLRLETPHARRSAVDRMREEQFFQALAGRAALLLGDEALGGRYSVNCVIYYVPDRDQEECARAVHELLLDERFDELDTTVGIAGFPFLDFTRSEILENARKALHHASMLHGDKIACFDSVSLNISADRLFAQEEIYDAVSEYKKALIVDENNFPARNSLGICYARLNKYDTARTVFQSLIQRHPNHHMALYNFGYVCLRDGDPGAARKAFERIPAGTPEHVYAQIRLGLIDEEEGNLDAAWERYQQILTMPDGEHLAYRYLARLAFGRDDRETAREYLHQAVTAAPRDAQSYHLLARIYLDQGEDPEVAESLARHSVHLQPEVPAFWEVLVAALEQQGKTAEAEQTRIRAAGGGNRI
jgi:diguanylate cyclase (GGDEF)-like protein